ncbi:unnamed protein product [Meloidogyne enterolobii]|uniref:Uncharacterized protein n=1 Tax=Meloidogyne enterolobii TaxID=390850 RepID=A0ACB1AYY7_MELEN
MPPISTILFILLIIITIINISTSDVCDKLKDDKTAFNYCKKVHGNREEENKPKNPKLRTKMRISYTPRYELACMSLGCICQYYGGKSSNRATNDCTLSNGQKLKKAKRKEWRMLTDQEKMDTFAAIAEMKKNGEFDYLARLHKDAFEAGKWHGCTSFFVVHREFLKRAEIILRKINPNISMPYMDVTLDARLPNPADSILFTKEFIGSTDGNGNVIDGPCANFKTLQGDPYITRNVGKEGGRLMNEDDVQWILGQTKLDSIMTYTVPGDKCPCEITNKWPEIFEKWRYMHQTREQRCTEYPKDNPDCCPVDQYRNSSMYLMEPLLNCDGLKNEYNDNMYEYEDRSVYTCNATTECSST